MYCFFVFSFYVFPFPTLSTACFICVCYFGPRVFRTSHTCMYQLLLSYLASLIGALFTFAMNVCLLLRQACSKNELITWMYSWLVFCCHFFQFSTLAIACLFAFVTPAGVFLERAIHAFIRFQLFQPRSYMCIISARVFSKTSHTCIFPFRLQLFQPLFRLASCFQNEPYLRSSVPFPTFPTAILYTFIISARVLNKSYGLTRPGTSLMRCSFTT